MCVRAIRLNGTENSGELWFQILSLIVGEDRIPRRVEYSEIAKKLDIPRQLVSYHVRELVKKGYIKVAVCDDLKYGYEPTSKIIFVEDPPHGEEG